MRQDKQILDDLNEPNILKAKSAEELIVELLLDIRRLIKKVIE
jgi:hypothetical protein